MKIAQLLMAVACLFGAVSGTLAGHRAQTDGTIVEQIPCAPNPIKTYQQYIDAAKQRYAEEVADARQEGFDMAVPDNPAPYLLSKGDFERQRKYAGFECHRIKYMSDRLRVAGFIWKPKKTEGKVFPLVIFNRGGELEFGKLTAWQRLGFYNFIANGFVVIASQYRGNDGGEGREQFGGADIHDVINLIPLAKSLGYVDMKNVFMLGWSRGGMTTYLALKNNIPVNAVAVGGGLTDLIALGKRRPAMVADVYKELIPDFDKRGDELMRDRSVMYWAEKIKVPLLIMQGGADWRVDPSSQTLAFAQKLQALGKTYELIVYANDDHSISLHKADSDKKIIDWFRRYMR
jgi:dipeptidyl aminopeptidase/acylaminoacyl peptidase